MKLEPSPEFSHCLSDMGIENGMHLLVHSSYRNIRKAFPGILIPQIIDALCTATGPTGSVIMPAFSYCFRKTSGETEIFDRLKTPARVGAIAQVFRTWPGAVRTSSPTHSFTLWGQAARYIPATNNPVSPLGKNSVPDWLHTRQDARIVMLGTDFNALSFGHFIEVATPVSWAHFSPWNHLGVQAIGVSVSGEIPLIELPGCSKSFVHFEDYLVKNEIISRQKHKGLGAYLIPVPLLFEHGLRYFQSYPDTLLCPQGSCAACDERWVYYLESLNRELGMG
ncbi:MAG: AAC(3) family N-acetyltransferase [Calditrichales bacterium]|nr:MAG: AAC(3) family N-acetyltransferase [Calditrichales bacterium]